MFIRHPVVTWESDSEVLGPLPNVQKNVRISVSRGLKFATLRVLSSFQA